VSGMNVRAPAPKSGGKKGKPPAKVVKTRPARQFLKVSSDEDEEALQAKKDLIQRDSDDEDFEENAAGAGKAAVDKVEDTGAERAPLREDSNVDSEAIGLVLNDDPDTSQVEISESSDSEESENEEERTRRVRYRRYSGS